jgi:hypothetical protein
VKAKVVRGTSKVVRCMTIDVRRRGHIVKGEWGKVEVEEEEEMDPGEEWEAARVVVERLRRRRR